MALRLGHRQSVDFDLFAFEPIDPNGLMNNIAMLAGGRVTNIQPNTLSVIVDRGGPVKVSLFGTPRLGRVEDPDLANDTGVPVASLLDLAGTKASVIQVRSEPKDYLDVDALLLAGVSLQTMLSAGRAIYGEGFSPFSALKALSYYGEPQLAALPTDLKDRLRAAVKAADPAALQSLQSVSRDSPEEL